MRPSTRKKIVGMQADWSHPTEIRFGLGRAMELPWVCWKLGITKPLLVTDKNLARRSFIKKIVQANEEENIRTHVFAQIEAEPDDRCIKLGARTFIDGHFNGIVAVGGGSALDAGKAIALSVAVGPSAMWSYTFKGGRQHEDLHGIPKIIAIPTTTGTGSEVDASAVILYERDNEKISLYHPQLLPKVVLADPKLTKGLIPFITATTGMDALSHNLEAFCSPTFHPILDAVALQGIRYVKEWLPIAFHEPGNLQARVYTMAASIMGAIAFDKGLGAMHGIAHAVGALFKVPHGRAIAAVMPFVLKFNRKGIEDKLVDVARYLDLSHHSFDGFMDWIIYLRLELGMPASLGELGVTKADIPKIQERAERDANMGTNPIAINEKKLKKLIASAVSGKL